MRGKLPALKGDQAGMMIPTDKAGTNEKSKVVGGLHKIEANPEKSKHLETVTTRILGLDIDLVNLRKETYTEESRNPQMEFGTPEEDALRRDATINAMFYNLNTREIEDFTGKGHDDMRAKIIRTPLDPYQTFKDDPLRVLRLIRFASRLDYAIDPTVESCMKDAGIKDALRAKISRERVGVELEKMLKGPDPLMALDIVNRNDLYDTIFAEPAGDARHAYAPDLTSWSQVVRYLHDFLAGSTEAKGQILTLTVVMFLINCRSTRTRSRRSLHSLEPCLHTTLPRCTTGRSTRTWKETTSTASLDYCSRRHQSH